MWVKVFETGSPPPLGSFSSWVESLASFFGIDRGPPRSRRGFNSHDDTGLPIFSECRSMSRAERVPEELSFIRHFIYLIRLILELILSMYRRSEK